MKYETHIVGFKGSLKAAPKLFFLNEVKDAAQGFIGIATVESDSLKVAYDSWVLGCRWADEQLKMQDNFACHVKLEETGQCYEVSLKEGAGVLSAPQRVETFLSCDVAAWDVHLDGQFSRELLGYLLKRGYIKFDYLDQKGFPTTTMTLHFLRPSRSQEEYLAILETLFKLGGLQGVVYWEHPLGFVVYGDTLPRPIVM